MNSARKPICICQIQVKEGHFVNVLMYSNPSLNDDLDVKNELKKDAFQQQASMCLDITKM